MISVAVGRLRSTGRRLSGSAESRVPACGDPGIRSVAGLPIGTLGRVSLVRSVLVCLRQAACAPGLLNFGFA